MDINIVTTGPAAKPERNEDQELKNACRAFESILVAQMLKEMRASVPKTDFFGSKDKEETFQMMLDQNIAEAMSQSGSFGIGDAMYNQLKITKVPERSVDTYTDRKDK